MNKFMEVTCVHILIASQRRYKSHLKSLARPLFILGNLSCTSNRSSGVLVR